MFLSVYHASLLLLVLGNEWPTAETFDGTNPAQRLEISVEPTTYGLDWADPEDRLQGTISPLKLVEGRPFTVSVTVGVIEGASFLGPVTMSLRPTEAMGQQQSQTVSRGAGQTWNATFTPKDSGEHVLEIAWRTTRLKQTRGLLNVDDAPVAAWFGRLLAGVVILAAISAGVWQVFRKPSARASDTP